VLRSSAAGALHGKGHGAGPSLKTTQHVAKTKLVAATAPMLTGCWLPQATSLRSFETVTFLSVRTRCDGVAMLLAVVCANRWFVRQYACGSLTTGHFTQISSIISASLLSHLQGGCNRLQHKNTVHVWRARSEELTQMLLQSDTATRCWLGYRCQPSVAGDRRAKAQHTISNPRLALHFGCHLSWSSTRRMCRGIACTAMRAGPDPVACGQKVIHCTRHHSFQAQRQAQRKVRDRMQHGGFMITCVDRCCSCSTLSCSAGVPPNMLAVAHRAALSVHA
jgi:hypothetical protein